MRRKLLPWPLLLVLGCGHADLVPSCIEQHIADVAHVRTDPLLAPCAASAPVLLPDKPIDLGELWDLALVGNPELRGASAEVEAARGRLIQAGLYPNPHIQYRGEEIGLNEAPKGNQSVEVTQEILTAGKRKLGREAAARGLDAAGVALLGRKFAVLTTIRRSYYDYLALAYTLEIDAEVIRSLERSLEGTRKLVEVAGTRPPTDLLRLRALLEQARIAQARTQTNLQAAWRELAAEVGEPALPLPKVIAPLPATVPVWPEEAITHRVQSAQTVLRQAALTSEQLRLEYEEARAEAVPNIIVGAGYIRAFVDQGAGANLSLETAIPLWDRKQGLIRERRARWAQAQAEERAVRTRLARDTAEAFGRYRGTREQAERLTREVLPVLEKTVKDLRQGYEAGAKDVTFADVQLAIEAVNDARLRLAEVKRELWRSVADLEGLMQLDLGEELDPGCIPAGASP